MRARIRVATLDATMPLLLEIAHETLEKKSTRRTEFKSASDTGEDHESFAGSRTQELRTLMQHNLWNRINGLRKKPRLLATRFRRRLLQALQSNRATELTWITIRDSPDC